MQNKAKAFLKFFLSASAVILMSVLFLAGYTVIQKNEMQSNAKEFCTAVSRGADFEAFRLTVKAYKPISVIISSSEGEVKKGYKDMDVLASDRLEIKNESISTVFRSGLFTAFCLVEFNEGKTVESKFSTLE